VTASRLQSVALIALMLGIGVLALLRPARTPGVPPRIATAEVQPWMVEALPWVGAKTAVKAMRAVQGGRLSELPARARGVASEVFVWPAHAGGGKPQ
jgi:hypothetical protein